MIILAIDSSALVASVAITDDTKLICEYTINTSLTHSETLLPMVESALKSVRMTLDDIDLFACSSGPGSFTGVRIGISLMKGLAFGKNKPCVAVSTLEALAYNLKGINAIICPVMDARRNQLYNALFDGVTRICNDRLISAEDLKSELDSYYRDIYFTGDGYNIASKLIVSENIRTTPHRLTLQSAYSVAMCAMKNYENNINVFDDTTIKPIYLRASQAERERNERIKSNEK